MRIRRGGSQDLAAMASRQIVVQQNEVRDGGTIDAAAQDRIDGVLGRSVMIQLERQHLALQCLFDQQDIGEIVLS